jgi:hypothetical protein
MASLDFSATQIGSKKYPYSIADAQICLFILHLTTIFSDSGYIA